MRKTLVELVRDRSFTARKATHRETLESGMLLPSKELRAIQRRYQKAKREAPAMMYQRRAATPESMYYEIKHEQRSSPRRPLVVDHELAARTAAKREAKLKRFAGAVALRSGTGVVHLAVPTSPGRTACTSGFSFDNEPFRSVDAALASPLARPCRRCLRVTTGAR